MVQADSLAILEQVVPVRLLRMPAGALSFFANFFSLKIEDKVKSRTSSSSDIAFEAVIKCVLKRCLLNKTPLEEVFSNKKKTFFVGSDSIYIILPANTVDCFKYCAKSNNYLSSIIKRYTAKDANIGRIRTRHQCLKNTKKSQYSNIMLQ